MQRSDNISGRSGAIIKDVPKNSQKPKGILKSKVKSAEPSLDVGQKKRESGSSLQKVKENNKNLQRECVKMIL